MRFVVATAAAVLFATTCLAAGQEKKLEPANFKSERVILNNYHRVHDDALAAFHKNGNSERLRHAYVVATVRMATATMVSPALPSKVKYRAALKYYREALKVDPTNFEAKHNSKMIEDIYRSLHRPIPH